MARPRKNDHNRDEILAKGIELFSEHGYHGAGLKLILDAVQVPKGSFYNYFESKEKFAAEVILAYHRSYNQRLQTFMETNTADPVSTIRILYAVTLDDFAKDDAKKGCLIGNLAGEIGGMSPICQQAMHTAMTTWRGVFITLLSKAQAQSLIRSDIPTEQLADIIWNYWQGSLLQLKIDPNYEQAKQALNTLLDAFTV